MKASYAHMNLPEPMVPAVQALQFAQGSDCAGDRVPTPASASPLRSHWQGWRQCGRELRDQPGGCRGVAEEIRGGGNARNRSGRRGG